MSAFMVSFINIVKRHCRDATPLIMQIIGPIIMITILGSALKGSFSPEDVINPVKLAVVNEDAGQASLEFISFLNSGSLDKLIKTTSVSNAEAAKQALKENKYNAVLEIKSNYSEGYEQGKYDGIAVTMINNDKTTFQIVNSILSGWKNNSSAIQIALKNGQSMEAITTTLKNSSKIVVEKPLTADGKLPKAIDYFSVTMIAMQFIFNGMLALGRLQEDFLSNMKNRYECSPVDIGTLLAGELMGTTILSFLQCIIIILFTHFVYGANWGNRWGIVLATVFLMALLGQMFAAALTLGLKNANAPQAIIGTAAMGLSFISGGFYTNPIGGAMGKFLATYGTPNALAQTALFGSIYGGSSKIIYMCLGIIAVLSILFLGLTIVFARRRVL